MALWYIESDTNVVSFLTAELEGTSDAQLSARLISDLGEIGPAASNAIPAIVEKMHDGTRPQSRRFRGVVDLRQTGRKAVSKIDPSGARTIGPSAFKILDLKEARLAEEGKGK
jgi:hypothetical protein